MHHLRRLVVCCVLAFPNLGTAALVELRAEATVSDRYIRLGDVARVAGPDSEEVRQFENAILGPAPVAGREVVLDDATIRARLRALGLPLGSSEFNGRSRVVVQRAQETPIPQAPLTTPVRTILKPARAWQVRRAEQLLVEAFRGHLALHAPEVGRVTIELSVPPEHAARVLEARSGGFEFRMDDDPHTDWSRGRTGRVRFLDRQHAIAETEVTVRLVTLPSVLVAKRTLTAGHVVRPEDVELQQVESADDAFTDVREVLDREATRTIRSGSTLAHDDIRTVPLVRRNDVITLSSRVGGITVTSFAKSRDDGGRGETIEVITLDGRRSLAARVTEFHEAEVISSGADPGGHEATRLLPENTQLTDGGFRFDPTPPRGAAVVRSRTANSTPMVAERTVRIPTATIERDARPTDVTEALTLKAPHRSPRMPEHRSTPPRVASNPIGPLRTNTSDENQGGTP